MTESKPNYTTVIFDLDGTLLDTLGDLRDSTNYALEKAGLPKRTTDEIRTFVGNGIRLLIERAVPAGTPESVTDECFAVFKEYYAGHSEILTKPYDGVIEAVRALRASGIKTAIVSNKIDSAIVELNAHFFPGLFDCTSGEKPGIRRKPAPDAVFEAMRKIGAEKEKTIYVGDSEVDVRTAHNAGLPCISCLWGFRSREVVQKENPEYIIGTPEEILKIVL